MRHVTRSWSKKIGLLSVLGTVLVSASSAMALPRHPILDHLQDVFVRLTYGGQHQPHDRYNNALSHITVLLPTPGDGTGKAATVDVKLDSDEPYFLPLFQLIGTSYSDGTPSDKFESMDVFKTLDITYKVDGKTVIDHNNVLDYYSQFYFAPPIKLDSPPIKAAIWLQAIGYVSKPLLPGKHTLTLHVKNTKAVFGGSFIEYNNTWNLTVTLPPKR